MIQLTQCYCHQTQQNPPIVTTKWRDEAGRVNAHFSHYPNNYDWPTLPSAWVEIDGKHYDVELADDDDAVIAKMAIESKVHEIVSLPG